MTTTVPGIPEQQPDLHDEEPQTTERQFVRFYWRDNKIQAEPIEENDLPVRYGKYESLPLLLDFVKHAVPGDSYLVKGDRILRFR